MRGHVSGDGPDTGAADILTTEIDARNQHAQTGAKSRVRQRIENLAIQYALLACALHVDHWCLASDGDLFFDPADPHVGIDASGKGARQLDPFPLYGRETTQCKRDRVGSGS